MDPITILTIIAEKRIARIQNRVPECFSVAYQTDAFCKTCGIRDLCGQAMLFDRERYGALEESDEDQYGKWGLKYGSRIARMVEEMGNTFHTLDELEKLSYSLFGTVINIDLMLERLRKRKALTEMGGVVYKDLHLYRVRAFKRPFRGAS